MTQNYMEVETMASIQPRPDEAEQSSALTEPKPVMPTGLQEILQQNARQMRQTLACAAVVVLLAQQEQLLLLTACALNLPETDYPASLQYDRLLADNPDSIQSIDLQKFSLRHGLVVKALYADKDGVPVDELTTDDLHFALRPLLTKSQAQQLQTQLNIQQIVALPLHQDTHPQQGVILIAYDRPCTPTDLTYLTALSQQVTTTIAQQNHLGAMRILEDIVLTMQSHMDHEKEVLQTIVDAVVYKLGYAGAMVATLEEGQALPARAYSLGISQALLRTLERQAGQSLISESSRVYLDDVRYKDNLSVRAVQAYQDHSQRYLLSDQLYDLLRPFVNRTLCDFIQRFLNIKQVAALPFFWEDQVVGNLFVVSNRGPFTEHELQILISFSQQAAAGLRNARLYRRAEEQRQIAERFGRMAFGATASIHKLRNQIGAARTYLHLLDNLYGIPIEQLPDLLADVPQIAHRLDQAADLLDSLHEPWQHIPDEPVNINYALLRALREVFPLSSFKPIDTQIKTEDGIFVSIDLGNEMPMVETTTDMLAEAFRIIIKNGSEALADCPSNQKRLHIRSEWHDNGQVVVIIQDEGPGISPTDVARIFDLGWSTKKGQGMGFGLFWVKDYIQGLGGSIMVDSQPNEGAKFRLMLPATVSWEHQAAQWI